MKSIDLASVDLNLLVAFEAIFQEQSVTGAAQRLHLGQPAMSAALGRLRTLFKDDLFVRVGRDMKPTTKALSLAPSISAALHQIRQTLEDSQVFDPATTQYTFAIGGSDYVGAVVLPKLLRYCQQFAPGIDIRLISFDKDQLGELFEQQAIAVVLGTFEIPPRLTQQVPLMQEHFVGICRPGHPLLAQPVLSLEDFATLPHALFTLRRDEVGAIDRALAAQNLKRRIALTTPYLLTLPALIAENDIVAAIPARLARQFVEQGKVAQFDLPLSLKPWSISMMWSQLSEQAPPNRWLRRTIQHICDEDSH